MLRYILWSLLVAYLIVVGLWPAAAAPVAAGLAGLAALIGLIPGPVWLLAAGIAWRKTRPAIVQPVTAQPTA